MVAVPRPVEATGIDPVIGLFVTTKPLSLESSMPAVRLPEASEVKTPPIAKGSPPPSIPDKLKAKGPASAALEKADVVC